MEYTGTGSCSPESESSLHTRLASQRTRHVLVDDVVLFGIDSGWGKGDPTGRPWPLRVCGEYIDNRIVSMYICKLLSYYNQEKMVSDNGLKAVGGVMDVQMYNPLETKSNSSASIPVVEDYLDDLVGLGQASLDKLYRYRLRNDFGPLRVVDLLRERNDGTIALEPRVRRSISNRYVDRFLDDTLALLDDPSLTPGYFNAPYNVRGRQHGGVCGIEDIKPSRHYPRELLDALGDLRGQYVLTSIGQSGCWTCGCTAISVLRESLEADDMPVRGGVGFSAQANPECPYIHYESFDNKLSTRELGQRIITVLEAHDVPFEWDGDPERSIKTYPNVRKGVRATYSVR